MEKIKMKTNGCFNFLGQRIQFGILFDDINFKIGDSLFDNEGKEYKVKNIRTHLTSNPMTCEVILDTNELPIGDLYIKK